MTIKISQEMDVETMYAMITKLLSFMTDKQLKEVETWLNELNSKR